MTEPRNDDIFQLPMALSGGAVGYRLMESFVDNYLYQKKNEKVISMIGKIADQPSQKYIVNLSRKAKTLESANEDLNRIIKIYEKYNDAMRNQIEEFQKDTFQNVSYRDSGNEIIQEIIPIDKRLERENSLLEIQAEISTEQKAAGKLAGEIIYYETLMQKEEEKSKIPFYDRFRFLYAFSHSHNYRECKSDTEPRLFQLNCGVDELFFIKTYLSIYKNDFHTNQSTIDLQSVEVDPVCEIKFKQMYVDSHANTNPSIPNLNVIVQDGKGQYRVVENGNLVTKDCSTTPLMNKPSLTKFLQTPKGKELRDHRLWMGAKLSKFEELSATSSNDDELQNQYFADKPKQGLDTRFLVAGIPNENEDFNKDRISDVMYCLSQNESLKSDVSFLTSWAYANPTRYKIHPGAQPIYNFGLDESGEDLGYDFPRIDPRHFDNLIDQREISDNGFYFICYLKEHTSTLDFDYFAKTFNIQKIMKELKNEKIEITNILNCARDTSIFEDYDEFQSKISCDSEISETDMKVQDPLRYKTMRCYKILAKLHKFLLEQLDYNYYIHLNSGDSEKPVSPS